MTKEKQIKLFQEIHDRYQYHYYDKFSNFYRKKIIINKIKKFFKDKRNILEIGCGGGSNYKVFRKEKLLINKEYLALDISPKAIFDFNKISNKDSSSRGLVKDFTEKNLDLNEKFDLILFMGVLHHMTNDLNQVMNNVKKHLNKNGVVIFFEPNAYFLNWLRLIWYKISNDFDDENERALTVDEIDYFADKNNLSLLSSKYIGNLGFFIILQSMILRTPKWIKFLLFLPLTYFDLIIENIQSKFILATMIRVYINK